MIETNVDIFSVYLFICIEERGEVVDSYGALGDGVRSCWVSSLSFTLLSLRILAAFHLIHIMEVREGGARRTVFL